MYVGSGSGWDSGPVGFIFDTEAARTHAGMDHPTVQQVTEYLTAEVNEYNQYLTNDVWGVVVERKVTWQRTGQPDTTMDTWEDIDSFYGLYGSEYAATEAASQFDYYTAEVAALAPTRPPTPSRQSELLHYSVTSPPSIRWRRESPASTQSPTTRSWSGR